MRPGQLVTLAAGLPYAVGWDSSRDDGYDADTPSLRIRPGDLLLVLGPASRGRLHVLRCRGGGTLWVHESWLECLE